MARLAAETLGGIWAAVPLIWDARLRLDEKRCRELLSRIAHSGAHGICITGSTGEFAALDDDEFVALLDIANDVCVKQNRPLQVGCGAGSTRKTLQRISRVAAKEHVGAVQVHLPHDMEPTDSEIHGFFTAIHSEFPDIPLVYSNVPKAGRVLCGEDFLRIRELVPTLVCVVCANAGLYFDRLQQAVLLTSDITYVVNERLLIPAMLTGARGSCGSFVMTNPGYVLGMYDHALEGRWGEAAHMQKLLVRLVSDMADLARNEGESTDGPVIDKAVMAASGFLKGPHHTRPPYAGWSKSSVRKFRQLMRKFYPQFLYTGEND